jgi:tRNA-binding protein
VSTPEIDFDQFLAVDMRVGVVTAVEDFPEARKPAWKVTIDFGPETSPAAAAGRPATAPGPG